MKPEPYYADEYCTLYSGDSLAVLAELETGSVDAVITDPPYSSGGMVRGDRTGSTNGKYAPPGGKRSVGREVPLDDFSGDNRDQRAYGYWMALWLSEALRVVKPGGVALLFTDWRQLPTTTDALQAGGFIWRGIVPWSKPGLRPMSGRFRAQCEYVVWGSSGAMPWDYESPCLPGFFEAQPPREREHLTQKPVDVMRELVQIVPPGGFVLDPFMGSGTTGVAAMIEQRRFIGCELAPHFAEVAERRIREAQGQSVERPDGSVSFDFGASV
jgi:site-specific DNA-methyltransferase (adenine-specific)